MDGRAPPEDASRGETVAPCAPRALCTNLTALFFSDRPECIETAKAICRRCELRTPCATAAAARREPAGVWGGHTAEELQAALDAGRRG